MNQDDKKQAVARAALPYVVEDAYIGVGTGSTVNYFIHEIASVRDKIKGAIASSTATEKLLREHKIPVITLGSVNTIPVYIDGADEATTKLHLIKGGGGALTREKIVAAASGKFICMIDDSKLVNTLGKFPLPVEVVPMAQHYVMGEVTRLGGEPILRSGFTTDNGNIIVDIHRLPIPDPVEMEITINGIAGVVSNGLFANRPADILLVAGEQGVLTLE